MRGLWLTALPITHRGIDIQADIGANFNGFMAVYAHNAEHLVEAGVRVSPGQLIADVGRTGRATSHHVHFEIRQAGLAYNPLPMLPLPPRPVLLEETAEDDHDDADE
jgi:hypothetical protein